MIGYEYECDTCGASQVVRLPMGTAPATVPCPVCQAPAYRVFSVGAIRTSANNPLRKLGGMTGGDMSTRAAAERTMAEKGLVMANERDCDDAERRARQRDRELDATVQATIREYNALPADAKRADAARVAKAERSRPAVPAKALA